MPLARVKGHPQAAAARRRLAARDEALTGTVRVSATDDVADILSPIVASFRVKHPGVSVVVDMRSAFADLARQQADVAVRLSTRALARESEATAGLPQHQTVPPVRTAQVYDE